MQYILDKKLRTTIEAAKVKVYISKAMNKYTSCLLD